METERPEYFPDTQTCFGRLARQGEADSVDPLLMEIYYDPLRRYFAGSRFFRQHGSELARRAGLSNDDYISDVLNGFFAARLGRGKYLEKWVTSGKRLSKYLQNGIWFHLKDVRKKDLRAAQLEEIDRESASVESDLGLEMDRELVCSIMREAIRQAKAALIRKGQQAHWDSWILHVLDGKSYREIGELLGIPERSADLLWRTARRSLEKTFQEAVAGRIDDPNQVNRAVKELLDALR